MSLLCRYTEPALTRAYTGRHTHTFEHSGSPALSLSYMRSLSMYVCCVCALFVWLHVCVCVHCLLSFIRARRTIGNGIINVNFNRFITLLGKSYNRLLTTATWRFHLIGFRSLRNSIDIEDLRIKNKLETWPGLRDQQLSLAQYCLLRKMPLSNTQFNSIKLPIKHFVLVVSLTPLHSLLHSYCVCAGPPNTNC